MLKPKHILFFFFLACLTVLQGQQRTAVLQIRGSVTAEENGAPISGVEVTTDAGGYALTNGLGEYRIEATVGDVLTFRSVEFETKRHTVRSDEDIDVVVSGYVETSQNSGTLLKRSDRMAFSHQMFLDSANYYKLRDIEKSIDFITKSIEELGNRGNKKELALSLATLGEVYQYHKQYDLAITSYEDALAANKSSKTTLLLGRALVLNGEFKRAERILKPLLKIESLIAYQKVSLYENLGDAYRGQRQIKRAVDFYEEGLTVAKMNQISPKMADLNSKIAEAYADENKLLEADAYFKNSLQLANDLPPQRAIQEKEKVADFYNQRNQYGAEIELRKNSLSELKKIPRAKTGGEPVRIATDSITAQRINYKIANAYIAQDKYDEAIPYLKESIEEAGSEDDFIVQKDATRKLSEVFEYKGNYAKAFETYRDYVALVDTLYRRKEQEILRAARFNREIATKQNRISGLEQERELSQSKYDLALTEQRLVQENNRRQQWVIYSLIFGIVLLGLATFFFYRSNQQQKLANNLLALKSLRSQMNPHFIFNALNSVNNYIAKSDERSANRYLSEFSTLMRSVLEYSEEDFIPLSKELEFLELYVKLEHSRFPEKFDYKVNIDTRVDVGAFQIPPMLLQPYIENAIWHGLRYKNEKGLLKIELNRKNARSIEIVVSDNGIGRKKSSQLKTQNQKKQKSKGMGNIKKRIAILNDMYKDKVDVHISDLLKDGSGTKVVFTLNKD